MSDEDLYGRDEQKKRLDEISKKVRSRQIDDIRETAQRPAGRRLIWRLLGEAGIFRSSFAANPHVTSLNEGKRDIGLMLLKDIMTAQPDLFTVMQKEAANDKLLLDMERRKKGEDDAH